MSSPEVTTIASRQRELNRELHRLIEEFQKRPECRGVQVYQVCITQVGWHNGAGPREDPGEHEELKSGPDAGYRVQSIETVLIIPR